MKSFKRHFSSEFSIFLFVLFICILIIFYMVLWCSVSWAKFTPLYSDTSSCFKIQGETSNVLYVEIRPFEGTGAGKCITQAIADLEKKYNIKYYIPINRAGFTAYLIVVLESSK